MSYNSKYFDRKPGSLENAVLEALGGQINEASMDVNLDDDKRLIQNIEKMKVKVKILSRATSGRGRVDVRLTGSKNNINKVVDGNQTSMRTDNDFAFNESTEVVEAKDMDKVNPDAVKKKFKDRKDKDIDNDGDVDSSDEYLHKRRKAISKAVKSEGIFTGLQKKGSDDSQAGAQTRSYQRQYGQGAKVGNPHRQMQFAKAAFKSGMKSRSGIVSYVEKETKSKIHPDVRSAINNSVKEEVELGEGKMKELAGKIATVYKKMKSDSKMKPFADKFRADVKKSLDIRKSLEKVLPDYVGGGDITKLMSEGKLDELSPSLLRRARDAAKARADKSAGRASTASKAGLSRVSDKESDKEGKARDQETKFARGARDAGERETEKAMQKGVLGKKGTSAKSKEKDRRKDVAFDAGPGKEKGSVAGVDRNVQKSKDAYTKYKEKGGGLSRSDYMKKFGSRLKREETEDWNEAVSIMQEKNDTMRETLAKMWSVEEGRNHNPFGEAADFKPHKMYDPKTGEAHDAKTMDDHLRMKKMGYTHTEPKKEQKTMTGQSATKVTVDPDIKEKKNIA